MTRIVAAEARSVTIPLDTPIALSNRDVADRNYLVVRVTGDDGHVGIGFCYVGTRAGALGAVAVRELLAPTLIGQDPHRVRGIWQDLYQEALLHGRAGTVMRALSALDVAIWDRNSRAAGLPLWRYLGGVSTGTVEAYASGGYYSADKGLDELREEMASYLELGFRAIKIRVGRVSPQDDAARLRAVREVVGPDVLVMLDANNAWRDLPTALRAIARWEEYDPYWIEEPFSPDDIDNHARLAARTPVLVATGEIEAGRWRHKHLIESGGAVILQTDAAVCGGVTEFQRIAATADSHGLTMSPHWFHDLHAHLVASTPNAQFVEYFPDDAVLNFRRLVGRQLRLDAGKILLHDEPGLGFDFDDEALERYATDSWS